MFGGEVLNPFAEVRAYVGPQHAGHAIDVLEERLTDGRRRAINSLPIVEQLLAHAPAILPVCLAIALSIEHSWDGGDGNRAPDAPWLCLVCGLDLEGLDDPPWSRFCFTHSSSTSPTERPAARLPTGRLELRRQTLRIALAAMHRARHLRRPTTRVGAREDTDLPHARTLLADRRHARDDTRGCDSA